MPPSLFPPAEILLSVEAKLNRLVNVSAHPLPVEPRIGIMFLILFISLFAVSFPGVSKQIRFLRIPHIVFFIGKHFGTGVILATAFCHLLQDAFESLQNPAVKERYHGIGKWTGLIILSALLSIFLVEYISTSYVDHIQADPSAPPSPVPSSDPSPFSSLPPSRRSRSPAPKSPLEVDNRPRSTTPTCSAHREAFFPADYHLITERTPLMPQRTKSLSNISHIANSTLPSSKYLNILNNPRLARETCQVRDAVAHNEYFGRMRATCVCVVNVMEQPEGEARRIVEEGSDLGGAKREEARPRIGRRRQVVGILVLQLGIMIHSLVIGLTLAVTSGTDFTSLVTAIIFHQLFEGFSLGIRISALPPSSSLDSSFPEPPRKWTSLAFNWLKPTLSVLFAITTPLGMAIGTMVFTRNGRGASPGEVAQMQLTQGLMSAISAGMLIYAATVEMIAGDFVFGDLGGSHGLHEHEHEHAHAHAHSHGELENAKNEEGNVEKSTGGLWKRILAVVSLLAGVAGMGLIGLGE